MRSCLWGIAIACTGCSAILPLGPGYSFEGGDGGRMDAAMADRDASGMDAAALDAETVDAGADGGSTDAGPPGRCYSSVAVGSGYMCVVRDGGTLHCWGMDGPHLGLGESACPAGACPAPVRVGSDADWRMVVAGSHTCGIRSDDSLWCWGSNVDGQLGVGDFTACAGGGVCSTPTRVGTDTDWSSVAVGAGHTCAIRTDGSLWCWGRGDAGQLGLNDLTSRESPVRVGTAVNWELIALGARHTCGIRADGTLWCWGANDQGELGVGSPGCGTGPCRVPTQVGTTADWTSVALGDNHTCATREDGSLWCWGDSTAGQLGLGDATECGGDGQCLAPARVGTDLDWRLVTAGSSHSCALKADGSVYCWGANSQGQLGLGDVDLRFSPSRSSGLAWSNLTSGSANTCAVAENGSTSCWGSNTTAQLAPASVADPRSTLAVALPCRCGAAGCEPCGSMSEACCASGMSCSAGVVCDDDDPESGVCVSCGGPAEPCCLVGDACTSGADCSDADPAAGVCPDCGGVGLACCTSGDPCTATGTACTDSDPSLGTCVVCGAPGERCCDGATCGTDAICDGTMCQECGDVGQPCCDGGSCESGGRCFSGTCEACGGVGQPCCDSGAPCLTLCGRLCDSGTDTCVACGGSGQPCCVPSFSCDACSGVGSCAGGTCP